MKKEEQKQEQKVIPIEARVTTFKQLPVAFLYFFYEFIQLNKKYNDIDSFC
jgi:hypothetical protein